MSRSSKRRKEQLKAKMKSSNARRKEQYEGMANSRGNSKREAQSAKRAKRKLRLNKLVSTAYHQAGDGPQCGNIGCRRCYSELNNRK